MNGPAQGAEVPWLNEVQTPPAVLPTTQLPALWGESTTEPSLERWQTRRAELLKAWREILGPMPERPASTTWRVLRTDDLPTVTRQLIEYDTEPGLAVQAYLLRPRGESADKSRAGVVALHPTTNDTIERIAGVTGARDDQTGLLLAERGFVVVCPRCFLWQDAPDLPTAVAMHRARHPMTLGMAKMLLDALRAVDLLVAQPDVDPKRMGACGHSLGAKETLYLAAFDERIRAAVASEGGIEFSSTNWDAPWYLGPGLREPSWTRQHHELLALTAPRAMLILGGEAGPGAADGDRSWPYVAAALPIYRLYAPPARLGLWNHREGHRLSPRSMERLVEWLETYTR
jgi:dienelactone hydrolase